MNPTERFHKEPLIADVLEMSSRRGMRARAVPNPTGGPRAYGATTEFFQAMPFRKEMYMVVHKVPAYSSGDAVEYTVRGVMVNEVIKEEPTLAITRMSDTEYFVHNYETGIQEPISLYDLVFLCSLLLHPTYPGGGSL